MGFEATGLNRLDQSVPAGGEPRWVTMPLPDGSFCAWRSKGKDAAAALAMLSHCTGLPLSDLGSSCGNGVVLPVGGSDDLRPGGFAIRRNGLRAYELDSGRFEALVIPWDGRTMELRGRIVRQLFFLGVLPRLLDGSSFLVHGALAVRGEEGFLFCGPSGIGKSTTVSRLNPDFQVLSDDCTLLTELEDGFYAQPVPTWSIWTSGKPECAFNCARIAKISRFCLLERGEHAVFGLDNMEALLGVMPSFTDMMRWHVASYPPGIVRRLTERNMAAAERLVRRLPGCRLRVKLDKTLVGGLL